MRQGLLALGLLAGCGPGAGEISGKFGDHTMSDLRSAWHGGPNILLFDTDVECIDTAWIERNYGDAAPEGAAIDFTGLQFTFDGTDAIAGTFSVAGAAQVKAFGLAKQGDTWDAERGMDGVLTLASVDEDHAEGTFDIAFSTGSLTGSFTTDYCRNIDP
jgi:hypothetical protein